MSPAHNGEQVTCPSCLNKFNTKAALIQHMETAITRCGIRDTELFRPTLSKLTGGILDTKPAGPEEDEKHPVEMIRDMAHIVLDEKAVAELDIPRPPRRVPGSERKDGAHQAGKRQRQAHQAVKEDKEDKEDQGGKKDKEDEDGYVHVAWR